VLQTTFNELTEQV